MTAKALVLRAAGTNCDLETAHAFERAGAETERIHINRIAEQPDLLDNFGILVVPGGFTYGDDVAAGRILANELTPRIAEPLHRFVERGSLVLGICNGFQVLLKTRLLPGWDESEPKLTLTDNLNGSFQARWVWLEPSSPHCIFTQGMTEPVYFPIAHAEGRFVARDDTPLNQLEAQGQIAFRYTIAPNDNGESSPQPANPNGSDRDIAGICDPTGRVMGLMPHPERHMLATQHPRWSLGRASDAGGDIAVDDDGSGMTVFRNAVECAVAHDVTS